MKINLVLLFFSPFIISQTIYNFDYEVTYKNVLTDSTTINHQVKLINSKNNNFTLNISKKDDKILQLFFSDYNNLFFEAEVNKTEFEANNLLNMSCDAIFKNRNSLDYKADEYDYLKLSDTMINDTTYYHYLLKSNKSLKHQKRKKLNSLHYIITKDNSEFQPILSHKTELEKWKRLPKIPNGIIKMKYYTNWKNEITNKIILHNITPIDKKMVIPANCLLEYKKGGIIIKY